MSAGRLEIREADVVPPRRYIEDSCLAIRERPRVAVGIDRECDGDRLAVGHIVKVESRVS